MIYFKKNIIDLAYNIINKRETQDDVKAFYELNEIFKMIQYYKQTGYYNFENAVKLNQKIRKDYPIIDKLDNLPSSGNYIKNCNSIKSLPIEINALDVDIHDILINALLKNV